MNKIAMTTIIFSFISILSLVSPQVCQADPQIKIYRNYYLFSPFASPLVIIDNEEQYKDLIENSEITGISAPGEKFDLDETSLENPQIEFDHQCLVILSAPRIQPKIKDIRNENNTFIIDVEYSAIGTRPPWLNGDFRGVGILIDRPEKTIKLSEKSANQYEEYYGNRLQCYRNSLNHTVDKELLKTRNKIIIKMFNDIYRLKRQFNELKNFNEDNARDPETKEITDISYTNNHPTLELSIDIVHPLFDPIEPGDLGPARSYIDKEYENICVYVIFWVHTHNNKLKNKLYSIIEKRLAPLDKLNNVAN